MTDFNFINSRLATGAGIDSTTDVSQLLSAGITHVIDCRAEFDDGPLLASSGMAYLYNPAQDDGQHPKPVSWFQASLSFALPALSNTKNKVYCHCAAGVNRGPSTAAAILMALGFGKDQTRTMIVAARPQAQIAYLDDAAAAVITLGYVSNV